MIFNMESYKEQSTPETETLTVIVNSPGPVRNGYIANATTGETTAGASFAGEYTYTINAAIGDLIEFWNSGGKDQDFTFDGTNPVTIYLST